MNETGQKLMERELAQEIRREWMTLMGCDAAEIEEACAEPSCFDPRQEQIMMDAAQRITNREKVQA